MMLIVVGVLLAVAYALIRLGSIPRELRTPTKLRRIDRRGMTLIEILIVIAILSILIAGLVQAVGLATLSGGKTLDAHAATTHARTTIAELRHGIRPLPSEPVRLDTQPGDLPSTLTLRRTPNTTTATAILEYRIGAGAAREVVQFEAVIPLPQGGDL
jgi:prepilin-type N-terminal cleavage/methylation domain-containing protein